MNYPLCHSAIGSIVSLDNCTPDTEMRSEGANMLFNATDASMKIFDDLVYTCENVSNMDYAFGAIGVTEVRPNWAATADSVFRTGGDAGHPETDDVGWRRR